MGWHVEEHIVLESPGKGMRGKGLSDMCEDIKSYLQEWSVEQIMKGDTVNMTVDPLGLFKGPQNYKVADLLALDNSRR